MLKKSVMYIKSLKEYFNKIFVDVILKN